MKNHSDDSELCTLQTKLNAGTLCLKVVSTLGREEGKQKTEGLG